MINSFIVMLTVHKIPFHVLLFFIFASNEPCRQYEYEDTNFLIYHCDCEASTTVKFAPGC